MKSETALNFKVPYGAFELKRSYQKHLGMGIIFSGLFFLLVMGGVMLYTFITTRPVEAVKVVRIRSIADLGAPPSISQTQAPQLAVAQPKVGAVAPKVGIPKAVPDEQAPEEVTIATQAELGQISDLKVTDVLGMGGGGDSISIEIPEGEYLPTPDEFVPREEEPVPIKFVQPLYPELARKAGIEGAVLVKALVDKHGKVRDALIAKTSGTNAGFEELALEYAYKNIYKPAISNGQPIAVWVVYKVEFSLK